MHLIYSLTHLRREVQSRINTTTDPITLRALTSLRDSYIRQDTVERHRINTSRNTPIRCGLSSPVARAKPSTTPHWSFNPKLDTTSLHHSTLKHCKEFFLCLPSEPTIQKLVELGGWRKGLKALGLGFFTQLKDKAGQEQALLQVLENVVGKLENNK